MVDSGGGSSRAFPKVGGAKVVCRAGGRIDRGRGKTACIDAFPVEVGGENLRTQRSFQVGGGPQRRQGYTKVCSDTPGCMEMRRKAQAK